MTPATRILTVTKGNVNNHHLYLTEVMDFFPPDAIGGKNRQRLAPRFVRILWGGQAVATDIVADKHIFRKRGWVGKFFDANRIVAGDRVLLEQLEPYLYRVSKVIEPISDRDKPVQQAEPTPTEPGCVVCAKPLDGSRRPILSRGLGGKNWLKAPVVLCGGCFPLLSRAEGKSRDRRRRSAIQEAVSFWFRCP